MLLFLCRLSFSEKDLSNFIPFVREEKLKKISSYKMSRDRQRSLFAELLVFYAVLSFENSGDSPESIQPAFISEDELISFLSAEKNFSAISDIRILEDRLGKPYLSNSKLHFCISHSGGYVCCAIGKKRIGVDIQRIKSFSDNVAKKILSPDEYMYLESSTDKELLFFYYWSLKEAYIKMTGEGLKRLFINEGDNNKSSSVTLVCTSKLKPPLPQKVVLHDLLLGLRQPAQIFLIDNSYVLALCTASALSV